jgi:hypothetical protein
VCDPAIGVLHQILGTVWRSVSHEPLHTEDPTSTSTDPGTTSPNGGSINYCIRWDSDAPVSADLRDEIHAPQCSGDTHDMSLWLTEGFIMKAGSASVQRGSFGTKIHIRM